MAKVRIVLPCYNPRGEWTRRIAECFADVCRRHPEHEFSLTTVDDGATRGYDEASLAILKESVPSVEILRYTPNRGKGYALRYALERSEGDFFIYTDYDFPYTDESFDAVLAALEGGADVVLAVRDKAYQRQLGAFRRFLSFGSHVVNRLFLGMKETDTQGGLKGMTVKGRGVFLRTTIDTFLFDTEFIKLAGREDGVAVKAVESRVRPDIELSSMGLGVMFKEMGNFFRLMFR